MSPSLKCHSWPGQAFGRNKQPDWTLILLWSRAIYQREVITLKHKQHYREERAKRRERTGVSGAEISESWPTLSAQTQQHELTLCGVEHY